MSAMEKAGSDETPDEAEMKGLGTPATRAGIIEKPASAVNPPNTVRWFFCAGILTEKAHSGNIANDI